MGEEPFLNVKYHGFAEIFCTRRRKIIENDDAYKEAVYRVRIRYI